MQQRTPFSRDSHSKRSVLRGRGEKGYGVLAPGVGDTQSEIVMPVLAGAVASEWLYCALLGGPTSTRPKEARLPRRVPPGGQDSSTGWGRDRELS